MADPSGPITSACILKMILSDCCTALSGQGNCSNLSTTQNYIEPAKGRKIWGNKRPQNGDSDVSFGISLCVSRITLYSSFLRGNSPLVSGAGKVAPGRFMTGCESQIANSYNLGRNQNLTE